MITEGFDKLKVFSTKLNAPLAVCAEGASICSIESLNEQSSWQDWSNLAWHNFLGWQDGWNNVWSNGCFITTACVEEKGLDDDCDELMTMRQFRDDLVQKDSVFRVKVVEYYEKAPQIIEKIQASNRRSEVLSDLYDRMIAPCVSLYKQGKKEECKELYLSHYERLAAEYLDA